MSVNSRACSCVDNSKLRAICGNAGKIDAAPSIAAGVHRLRADNSGMRASMKIVDRASAEAVGNARAVREYLGYLRVEKGMRPATCEAYVRDLEQFAEQLETRDG